MDRTSATQSIDSSAQIRPIEENGGMKILKAVGDFFDKLSTFHSNYVEIYGTIGLGDERPARKSSDSSMASTSTLPSAHIPKRMRSISPSISCSSIGSTGTDSTCSTTLSNASTVRGCLKKASRSTSMDFKKFMPLDSESEIPRSPSLSVLAEQRKSVRFDHAGLFEQRELAGLNKKIHHLSRRNASLADGQGNRALLLMKVAP